MTVRDEGQGWDRFRDDQVGLFALCDGSVGVTDAHCVCRVDCAGVEGLFWGQTHSDAAEGHHETHVTAWA